MKHIVVTTDFSPAAEPAFDYAKKQARLIGKEQCKITLLTVIDDVAPANITFEYGLAIANKRGIVEKLEKQATEKMKELLRTHFSDYFVESVVLKPQEPVYQEIVEFAKYHDADLIVMSTHGRTGIKHFLLGSVAERVIRQSSCPVMVVPVKSVTEQS
ncbi:MAG: universal stress protein [Candidatus Brocadiaceae bacterium]|nr:universal stress protein [Candidatus Brocadiaceae bacterium]